VHLQQVVGDEMTAAMFTNRLQAALNSVAQPHLEPFLQRTLPALREAIQRGDVIIEGVNAPVPIPAQQQQVCAWA
jgi:hypothetical protein